MLAQIPYYLNFAVGQFLHQTHKLNKKIVFWDQRLQELFETSKQTICNEISNGLTYFNILKPIIVNTD